MTAVSVPLDATYTEGDLRDYLENIAARYDTESGQAGFDLATLSFSSGRAGRRLDIDQAIPLVEQALLDPEPDHRRVVLPLANIDATRENVGTLREAILSLMQSRALCITGRIRSRRCTS